MTDLSKEEPELLESFEKGQWQSKENLEERKKELQEYARNTLYSKIKDRVVPSLLLLISLIFFADHTVSASDDECFCIKHKKSEAVIFDCSEFKGPDDFYATIWCKTKIVTGKKKRIDIKK